MVTAPLLMQVVRLQLPKAEQTEPAPNLHVNILSDTGTGQAMLDEKPDPIENLEAELSTASKRPRHQSANASRPHSGI